MDSGNLNSRGRRYKSRFLTAYGAIQHIVPSPWGLLDSNEERQIQESSMCMSVSLLKWSSVMTLGATGTRRGEGESLSMGRKPWKARGRGSKLRWTDGGWVGSLLREARLHSGISQGPITGWEEFMATGTKLVENEAFPSALQPAFLTFQILLGTELESWPLPGCGRPLPPFLHPLFLLLSLSHRYFFLFSPQSQEPEMRKI